MDFPSVLLLALGLLLGSAWVTIFVGELMASRRGLASITDAPEVPGEPTPKRPVCAWQRWLLAPLLIVCGSLAVLLAIVVVAPPVLAVKWIRCLTTRST